MGSSAGSWKRMGRCMMTDAANLTAREMLAGFRSGRLSPVEATLAVLARIEEADPLVNAYRVVTADQALAAARDSAERWHRGEPRGMLDGVPVSVKDLLLTRGVATPRGAHAIHPGGPWDEDAPSVPRVRGQGAGAVGKTTPP